MGKARDVMDRLTAAATETKDFRALAECYADDAIAVTPIRGNFEGARRSHEAGSVAINEGYII
jgi:ketosteroid isomerase-like protein